MPPASVDDLVRLLLDGGLLEPEQRAALDGLQAAFPDPRALARELVQRGWLTPYQVNRLMQGRVEEMLLGPYVLLEGVGEGGMGQVFKARHRVMNRVVALKLIRKEQLDSGAAVQRFRREIQAAGQLAHPNIVMAHDAGQVGERHFLVMEYVAGVDLGRLVRQQGPLAVPQACAAARQAALGLQHAHERGLVHRDVKPSNLLLASDGVVKLLDLGLARPFAVPGPSGAELTQSGVVMGTPDYLAPEQALDPRAVDIRADIYSLGCTLYFLLTGRPPFPTEGSLTQKLLWHQHADPDAVEAVRPDVPPALSAVLRRLMARRPADRYQTPGEAAAALVPFCAGPPALPTALPETVSLTAAPADAPTAPERGWTLTTDPSLPEVAVPSLVEAKAAPARGWTVATEPSLPPPPALPPPWPGGRCRLAVVGAAGALALGVVLVVLFWPSSAADRGQGPSGSNANDARAQAPPPKETAGAKGETPPVKTPDPVAKSPDKPGEAKPTPPIQQPEPRPVVPNPPPPPGVKVLWSCDERAPLTLQITPKLGLKATVRVDSASSYHRLAFAESQGRAAFPEREHGLKLLLDQGSGVYLVIPFGLVQHIASQKKEHLVTLADGSRHPGKVLTVVSSDDKRTFDLASAQSVVVLQGPAPKRTEVRRATVALTVREPGKMAFEVFSAKLSTRGAFGEAFTVKVAGEELQCNLSDFEKITLWKRGDNWHMTLKVPGAEAREGEFFLPNGWWFVAGDAPNGVVVLLRGHTRDGQFADSPGITIERRLSP